MAGLREGCPAGGSEASTAAREAALLEHADTSGGWRYLLRQAHALGCETFDKPFDIDGFAGTRHITLVVTSTYKQVLGYCLYYTARDDGPQQGANQQMLWIEQLVVRDGLRRCGLGRRLMASAEAHARQAGCWAVKLQSKDRAWPFYRVLGYELAGPGRLQRDLRQARAAEVPLFRFNQPWLHFGGAGGGGLPPGIAGQGFW